MSYIKKVLADRPLAFWTLSTHNLPQSALNLVTYGEPHVGFNGADIYSNILPVNTSIWKDSNSNQYEKITGFRFNDIVNDVNINTDFNIIKKGTENLSFGIEFWFTIPPSNTEYQSNLFWALDGDSDKNILSIWRSNDIIYFKLSNDLESYTAYKQIKSTESQIHLFAGYSNRTIHLYINGMPGESVKLPNSFEFLTASDSATYFQFPKQQHPVIMSSLAIYNKILSEGQIKSHILWGLNNASPKSFVKNQDASLIDINENINNYWYKKDFNNQKTFLEGNFNNLIFDNGAITLKPGPFISTNFNVTKLNAISDHISLNNFSIIRPINWVSGESAEIIKLDGINGDNYLTVSKTIDDTLSLNYISNSNTSVLLETPAFNENFYGTFIFSVNGSNASLYIDNIGSFFTSNLPNMNVFTSNLYYGYQNISGDLIIYNTYVDPNAWVNDNTFYENNIAMKVNQEQQIVRKKGYWEYSVPASLYYNVLGNRILWDTATTSYLGNNIDDYQNSVDKGVYVEINKGSGWEKITNTNVISNFSEQDFTIRVNILSGDINAELAPRVENLSIVLYKNLNIYSDDARYIFVPSDYSTYVLKNNDFNVLSRSNNLGIKLGIQDNPGDAAILMQATPSAGYRTLEFWFKFDDVQNANQDQYIINNNVTEEYLKFDKDSLELTQSGFDSVYVNGMDLSVNTVILIKDEPYHIVCIYSDNNLNNVFFNSDINSEKTSIASYGHIATYPNALTENDIKNRYISYITNFTEIVAGDYLNSSNFIGTISEYSGISTDYNNGKPINSYQNASTKP